VTRTLLSLTLALIAGCNASQATADVHDLTPASPTERLWLASTLFGDLLLQNMPPHPF
jgi:hypothetical protein